jgi:hypothetical protein
MLVAARPQLTPAKAGAVHQGAVVAQVAGGVPAPSETVLGTAPVGARILLRDGGRCGREDDHEYIENQKWDEDDQGFKITAPTEP